MAYTRKNFQPGDTLTASDMNDIEDAIVDLINRVNVLAPTTAPATTTAAPTTTLAPTPTTTVAPGTGENLLLQSEDLSAWNVDNNYVTANQALDMEGNNTMDLCEVFNYSCKIWQEVAVTPGQTYYLSWDGILGSSNDVKYMIYNPSAWEKISDGNLAANLTSTVSRQQANFTVPAGCTAIRVQLCVYDEYFETESVPGTITLGRLQLATTQNAAYVETQGTISAS